MNAAACTTRTTRILRVNSSAGSRHFCVYQLRNKINDKKYIGKSWNPEKRWVGHQKTAKSGHQNLLCRAIRKHGIENFELTILHKCRSERRTFLLESFFIRTNKTLAPNGYNLTLGGEGMSGFIFNQESRNKMSKIHKNQIPWNKGKKTGQTPWNKGRTTGQTPWNKGKKTPKDIRLKISHASKGLTPWNKGKITGQSRGIEE